MRYAERHTRKLGRAIFHAMVRLGPKLERRQLVLFRAVDIGAELFAMSAACVKARMLVREGRNEGVALADLFCRAARVRVDHLFAGFYGDYDAEMYRVAQSVMKGEHAWLETGIISMLEHEARDAAAAAPRVRGEPAGVGD